MRSVFRWHSHHAPAASYHPQSPAPTMDPPLCRYLPCISEAAAPAVALSRQPGSQRAVAGNLTFILFIRKRRSGTVPHVRPDAVLTATPPISRLAREDARTSRATGKTTTTEGICFIYKIHDLLSPSQRLSSEGLEAWVAGWLDGLHEEPKRNSLPLEAVVVVATTPVRISSQDTSTGDSILARQLGGANGRPAG